MIYLHKTIGYWKLDHQLPSSYKVGTTENDYHNGAYIALNSQQILFHQNNPKASHVEVLNCALKDESKFSITLDEAKKQKIYEIKKYANSCDVKTFFLNEVATWIEVDQRYQAMMTINSAKSRGDNELTLDIDGTIYTGDIDKISEALDQINTYVNECSIVTTKNIGEVNSFSTVDEVISYDFKINYPSILKLYL